MAEKKSTFLGGNKMKFPEKYILKGEFTLHSGEKTDIFYDVNALITDPLYFAKIYSWISRADHYVGIATGGAILAGMLSVGHFSFFSMIKDKELKGRMPKGNWTLIDDVATTESSLREALSLVDSEPKEIFVVMDRRKIKN
jgi:orotate phosphoribosyltransferase